MKNFVTNLQAIALYELGLEKRCRNIIHDKNSTTLTPTPTVDQAIDWLRRKFNVMIYDAVNPFVDATKKNRIVYSYRVKYCNVKHGWNQREFVGKVVHSTNSYSAKRMAIWTAIRYIKRKKWNRRHKSSISKKPIKR